MQKNHPTRFFFAKKNVLQIIFVWLLAFRFVLNVRWVTGTLSSNVYIFRKQRSSNSSFIRQFSSIKYFVVVLSKKEISFMVCGACGGSIFYSYDFFSRMQVDTDSLELSKQIFCNITSVGFSTKSA